MKSVELIDSAVIEQTIRFAQTHPDAIYEDYVKLLDWYWSLPPKLKSGWVFDWIKALT